MPYPRLSAELRSRIICNRTSYCSNAGAIDRRRLQGCFGEKILWVKRTDSVHSYSYLVVHPLRDYEAVLPSFNAFLLNPWQRPSILNRTIKVGERICSDGCHRTLSCRLVLFERCASYIHTYSLLPATHTPYHSHHIWAD
jgi:hypothetical protein